MQSSANKRLTVNNGLSGSWNSHERRSSDLRWRVAEERDIFGEVEFGLVAPETEGGLVVGSGRGLGSVKGA